VKRGSGRNALLVGAGILASRVIGFVRERVFAHYLGNSAAADAFKAALRIPNLLQNLFGEGALSASFIPVYARLLAGGDRAGEEEARRVARAVGTALAAGVSLFVLVGMLATPLLIDLIAPGFEGEKRDWTIRMVRVLFPGVGLLVMSAWCLGILNSHRRFFLPYAAPVVWNGAMIAALFLYGRTHSGYPLALLLAFAASAGSALQLAIQLPAVRSLAGRLHPQWDLTSRHVRSVLRNFGPSVGSRGVAQVSAYVDTMLASFLPTGAVAALAYAQTLYLLPVSLFGMSVSAAELPEMASGTGTPEEIATNLQARLSAAARRVAFFVVPSAVAFLALGDVVVAALYQTGRFTRADVLYVWAVVAGSSVGLLAQTLARLYSSAFWALHDTRTPLKFAVWRVLQATLVGWYLAFQAPRLLGLEPRWGLAGLTISAGLAGWAELLLLRHAMNARVGRSGVPASLLARLWGAALFAAAAGYGLKLWLGTGHPMVLGALVLGTYGVLYVGLTLVLGVAEARAVLARLRR